jgi:hypothetical protein
MLDDRFSRFLPLVWLAFLAVFVLVLVGAGIYGSALAQDTITVPPSTNGAPTVITLQPLWEGLVPYIVAALGAIITGVVAWAGVLFNQVTGARLDAKAREALHSAAMTGVNLAIQQAGGLVGKVSITTKNQIVTRGVEWVLQSVPGAIARFGLSPEQIGHIVESKLPHPTAEVVLEVDQAPQVSPAYQSTSSMPKTPPPSGFKR